MLAKIAPGSNDFHAVARYLVHGRRGTPTHPNRVDWMTTRNLPTNDAELAATYMRATAERSRRTKHAAYHVMIAWHERERPTPELMQAVAAQTIELADLGEHQALIIGHGDKPHAHLHILLNRVHPESGRAWKTAHDFARFDRIMRQLSEQHGCEYIPAHAFNPDLTDHLASQPDSAATYAAKRGADTARTKWSKASARKLGQRVTDMLDDKASLDDLQAILAHEGLRLEQKGRGLVAGNVDSYATLSSLGLAVSGDNQIRFRARAQDQPLRRPLLSVDGVDIVRGLHAWGLADRSDIEKAVADAAEQRRNRLALVAFTSQLSAQLVQALKTDTSLKPAREKPLAVPKPRGLHTSKPTGPSR